jgi:hypothetical protein
MKAQRTLRPRASSPPSVQELSDGPVVGRGVLVGPQELDQGVEVRADVPAAAGLLLVHADDDPLGVDELDDAGPAADDDVARALGDQPLDARADEGGLRPDEGHGLALHVRAHQGPVGVVVLEERDEGGGQGDELFRGDVEVVDLLAGDVLEIAALAGADEVVLEPAALVDRGVGLGDVVLLFLPRGQVEAVGLDGRQLPGLLVLELVDGLGHLVLLDDVADLVIARPGVEDLDEVDDPPVLDLAVGRLDETVLVDPGETAERGDEADVRAFRRLDRADPAVVRGLDVADLEAGPFAAEAAGAEGREAALVRDLGQGVDLVHELGELGAAEEFLERGDDRLGVDEVLGHGRRQVRGDGHLLLDRPFHAGQADTEGVLDELADRPDPAVAEVVDVVDHPLAEAEAEEVLEDLDVILGGQRLVLERRLQAELDVELEPADAGEIVFLGIEEQAVEEVVGALLGVGLARPQLAVDLAEGLGLVLTEVLLERRAPNEPGPVVLGVEDLERLSPAGQEIEMDLLDGLVDPDLALDPDQAVGAEELLLQERDPRDAGGLERGQDLGGDLLLGRRQDLAALGVGDVVGRGLPDQAVRDFPEQLPLLDDDLVEPVEELQDILVRAEAQGPEEDAGQELLLTIESDPDQVLGIVLEFDPGAAVRDDLGDEEALGLGLAEEHAGRALELADDDALDAVEDERALLGHERDVAEIDFLLLDVLEPLGLGRGVLLPGHELDLEFERDGVGVTLLDALHRGVLDLEPDAVAAVIAERDLDLAGRAAEGADFLLGELHARGQERLAGVALGPGVLHPLEPPALALPGPDRITEELELGRLLEVGDGEDVLQRGLEAGVLPLLGQELHLEELRVGRRLDVQEFGHREDGLDLREVVPLAIRRSRFFGHVVSLSSRDRVSPVSGAGTADAQPAGSLTEAR